MTTEKTIIFPPNAESVPTFSRFDSLISPNQLIKRYLFGVKFLDAEGNKIPDRVFADVLDNAISSVEHEFDMTITPTTYTESKDYRWNDYANYAFLKLNQKPIISVESITMGIVPGQTLFEVPSSWIRLYSEQGLVQLVATVGSLSQFNIGSSPIFPRIFSLAGDFPQLFRVKYIAGFESGRIPRVVNNYIGLTAAVDLLSIAGDLIIAPGISSQSISLDGLSQTLNSTLSAENSGYGGRVRQYNEQLKLYRNIIRKYYRGREITVM